MGNCVTVAVAVTVARGVDGVADAVWVADGVRVEAVGVADEVDGAGELGARVAEEETETETETETDAVAVVSLPLAGVVVAGALVAGRVVVDPPPVGDGVRVAECPSEPDDDVTGDGVKVDGTEEPPAVQAEAVTVSSTAPAARRPAASHASRVAAGVLSRIFMDPPRTRLRYTR